MTSIAYSQINVQLSLIWMIWVGDVDAVYQQGFSNFCNKRLLELIPCLQNMQNMSIITNE